MLHLHAFCQPVLEVKEKVEAGGPTDASFAHVPAANAGEIEELTAAIPHRKQFLVQTGGGHRDEARLPVTIRVGGRMEEVDVLVTGKEIAVLLQQVQQEATSEDRHETSKREDDQEKPQGDARLPSNYDHKLEEFPPFRDVEVEDQEARAKVDTELEATPAETRVGGSWFSAL